MSVTPKELAGAIKELRIYKDEYSEEFRTFFQEIQEHITLAFDIDSHELTF